jgi:hypothetical protein
MAISGRLAIASANRSLVVILASLRLGGCCAGNFRAPQHPGGDRAARAAAKSANVRIVEGSFTISG